MPPIKKFSGNLFKLKFIKDFQQLIFKLWTPSFLKQLRDCEWKPTGSPGIRNTSKGEVDFGKLSYLLYKLLKYR
jgi:hypothetical protein